MMIPAFQFVGPIIAAFLYVIVFQKAGFRGPILALCAAPLVGSVLGMMLFRVLLAGGSGGMFLIQLVALPVTLLPLLILAFKSWPPAVAPNTRSEL